MALGLAALIASASNAQDQRHDLGVFSNVQISENSGDCSGVSVRLWQETKAGGKPVMSGVFYDVSGSCPGRKYSLGELKFDSQSGSIEFIAKEVQSGLLVAKFQGLMDSKGLHGQFAYGHKNTGEVDSWSAVELNRLGPKEWARVGD